MTKASGINVAIPDVVKLILGAVAFAGMWFDLKMEVRANKTYYEADKRIINYRLATVEKCCGIAAQYAVLPKETKIENE